MDNKRECKAVTNVLLVFTSLCYNTPTSFVVLEKMRMFRCSDNPVLRTLALCCRDAVGAVCDLYKMTTHDLVVLPVYMVNRLSGTAFRGRSIPSLG